MVDNQTVESESGASTTNSRGKSRYEEGHECNTLADLLGSTCTYQFSNSNSAKYEWVDSE